MERSVLINELCWEYGISKAKAEEIVLMYEDTDKYEDLCEFVKTKQSISVVIRENV